MPTNLPSASAPRCAPFLIDISRLIWRLWSGRMPTGIDRVCLAYLAHFGGRADAVLQWKGRHIVFAGAGARRVLALLTADLPRFRRRLVATLGRTLPDAFGTSPCRGQIYLNIGHTGLDDPALVAWIGRSGLRAVHLVHDLIPIEAPEFCRPGEAQRHARRMTNALSSASGIICNSQATLEALHRFATANGLPDVLMVTAWLAADALPPDVAARTADRPYFVVVGTIEGRKNHWLLLQIWKRLAMRMGPDAPRLMLVGQRGWEAAGPLAMLDRCPALQDTVIELGRCSDTDLASLLKGARALLMPSFVEGFGMPVVEALRLNTPVIASDLPVFREIAGSIPTYADPLDAITWERLILDFCGPSAERARQSQAMQGYRAPDWASHFQTVEQWLAGIAESPARSLPG